MAKLNKEESGVKKQETQSFEDSLKRLEKIVEEMEAGKLSLDEMIARFEEGQGLLKTCQKKLAEVQKKVEVLVKKNGELETEPYDTDEGGESSPGDDQLF